MTQPSQVAVIVSAGLVALLAGCGPASQPKAKGGDETAASCPDGAPRLPLTGLCQTQAEALLKSDPEARTPELPDCAWTINETMLAGDEALLYRAATCNGVTAKLGFVGGAKSAELVYEQSGLLGDAVKGAAAPVRLFSAPDDNPQGALKAAIAEAPDSAAMQCEIRPAGLEGWPTDALVIAPSAAARAKLPQDEPIAACGPTGLDEDSIRYWRVSQGYAWFFDLGQDATDFDPTSLTVLAKDADGAWGAKE